MYAIVKNVANPPRISLAGVEPRLVIWKNESRAPRAPTAFLEVAEEGMAHSVGQRAKVKDQGRGNAQIRAQVA